MGNLHIAANYLFVQPLIAQRLCDELPGVPVRSIDSLASATENDVRDTLIYVLFEGERFTDESGDGLRNMVRQRYAVMLAVEHKRQNDDAARNAAAGPVLSKIHLALSGYTHEHLHSRTFKRTNGRPPIYTPGVALYPLTFEILVNL